MESKALNVKVTRDSARYCLSASDSKGFRYHVWMGTPGDRSFDVMYKNELFERAQRRGYKTAQLNPHAACNAKFVRSMLDQATAKSSDGCLGRDMFECALAEYDREQAEIVARAAAERLHDWRAKHAEEMFEALKQFTPTLWPSQEEFDRVRALVVKLETLPTEG